MGRLIVLALLAGTFGLAALSAADPSEGLLVSLLCNGGREQGAPTASSRLTDSSLRENHGHLRGSSLALKGAYGSGLLLRGGDYIEVPYSRDFEGLAGITVSGWFHPDGPPLTTPILIGKWDHPEKRSFMLYAKPTGALEWGVGWSKTEYLILRDGPMLPTKAWSFIVGTWDGKTGALRLYRNGELGKEVRTPAGVRLLDSATPVVVGTHNNDPGGNSSFTGGVSRVRLWNRALASGEVKAMYERERKQYTQKDLPMEPRLTHLVVGSEKQLFLDDAIIERMEGTKRVVNRPQPTGENCVPVDKPWEANLINCFGESVLEVDGVCRLYYTSWDGKGRGWLCLATSRDGIHWEKPEMDLVPFEGIAKTNIVYPDASCPKLEGYFFGTCVFRDTNPQCPPEQQYKMINGDSSTWVFASPDALHFKPVFGKPSFRPADTNNICFFDDRIGRYVAYMRSYTTLRVVGRCEFDNLADFGKDRIVFASDEEDQRALDKNRFDSVAPYNSSTIKYPYAANAYLMFPTMFYHFPEPPVGKVSNDGIAEMQFATSRDGIHWTRLDRHPYIPLQEGEYGNYMVHGMIRRGDRLYLYYGIYYNTHGLPLHPRDHLSRAVLRLDGFVSVEAPKRGSLTTIPLVFSGSRLELNVAGGTVRAALLDAMGRPLPGFDLGDCIPLRGDHTAARMRWHGGSNLSKFAGREVKLRFEMQKAKLYAFQFAE